MISFYNSNTKRFLSRFDKALVLIILFCSVASITFLLTRNTVVTTFFSILLTFILALIFFVTSQKASRSKASDKELLELKHSFQEEILQSSQTTFLTLVCNCFSKMKGFMEVKQRSTHAVCFYKGTYTAIKVIHPDNNFNAIEIIWRFAHQLNVLDMSHGILVSAIPLEEKHYTAAQRVSGGKIFLYEMDELINAQIHLALKKPYSYSFFARKGKINSKEKKRSYSALMFFTYAFVILLSALIVGASWLRLFYAVLAIISAMLGLGIAVGPFTSKKPANKH